MLESQVTVEGRPLGEVRETFFLEKDELVVEAVRKLTTGTINTKARYRRDR